MIEIPFYNDFYSLILPDNHEEIIEHCLNATELPEESFQWGEVCLSEKVYLKHTGFTELLKPFIIEILSKVVEVPYSFSIEEVWKNTYHRNYHQEQHDHRGYELSFVIFMEDYKENDAKFYFVNERNRVTPANWLDISHIAMADDLHIAPKRGEILFFPSHLLHGVSPHLSDEPRITISGNITLQDLRNL